MKKQYQSVLGFIILALGVISLVLSLVGLKLDFLSFLYSRGIGFAFLIHIIMIFGGAIILYMSKLSYEE